MSIEKKIINPFRMFVGSFLPNWLLRRKELSSSAKLVYARLCQFAGKNGVCTPSQTVLADEVGMGLRTVQTHLKDLEAAGLIQCRQRGLTKSNDYVFFWHKWMEEGDTPEMADLPDSAGHGMPDSARPEAPRPAYKENQGRESDKRIKPEASKDSENRTGGAGRKDQGACGPEPEPEIPMALRGGGFEARFAEWRAWRRKRKACKDWPSLWRHQLALLATFGREGAMESILNSMAGDWQGLFPPKSRPGGNGAPTSERDQPRYIPQKSNREAHRR